MIPALLALLAASAPADRQAVMKPIDGLFAALAARDGQRMLGFVRPEGGTTAVIAKPDGTQTIRHESWAAFAAHLKPGPERYRERLIDPEVRVDGGIAMVWGRYVFTIDGKPHHCGVDHFDLVREGGAWKVVNVTFSQRATGC